MPGGYNLDFKRSAKKEFERLPDPDLKRVDKRIRSLTRIPRPRGCEKLTSSEDYRVRQGDCRIVYQVDDTARTVTIARVGHRREVYR